MRMCILVETMRMCILHIPLVIGAFAAAAAAEVVQLGAAQDNTLYEDPNGALSNGAGSYFFTGSTGDNLIRRGLIRFDVSSVVPPGATVTSAQLTLHVSMTSSGPQTVSLHRVSAAWGEGTSDAPAGEGALDPR